MEKLGSIFGMAAMFVVSVGAFLKTALDTGSAASWAAYVGLVPYLLPLLIMAVCYAVLTRQLHKSGAKSPAAGAVRH